ncbi:MAG: hypothetical protein JXR86_18110 [Spirochaetales bacterium]|nr:hypothetical protein [Spirochaetales bacterium]
MKERSLNQIASSIRKDWTDTVRYSNPADEERIPLSRPFTVPCKEGHFQELYYWDTYFTSVGLLHSGETAIAKNNLLNLLEEVALLGFVPNSNRKDMLNRSQPPFLIYLADIMVKNDEGGTVFLQEIYPLLEREYDFWINERTTFEGLQSYGHKADVSSLCTFSAEVARRIGFDLHSPDLKGAGHLLAEAESGWDFTPRFEGVCSDFLPVDLNSLLYGFETIMADFALRLGREGDPEIWAGRRSRRREKMAGYLWDGERGVFTDYNFRTGKKAGLMTAASLFPLWTGIASEQEAGETVKALKVLEFSCGIAATESGTFRNQWAYPNGWPPLQYIAYRGLDRYGYRDDAERLAVKYINIVESLYERTGHLWEKYNVADPLYDVLDEYKMPPMMGWTAGVYLDALQFTGRLPV